MWIVAGDGQADRKSSIRQAQAICRQPWPRSIYRFTHVEQFPSVNAHSSCCRSSHVKKDKVYSVANIVTCKYCMTNPPPSYLIGGDKRFSFSTWLSLIIHYCCRLFIGSSDLVVYITVSILVG